jgi:hypothetical protein
MRAWFSGRISPQRQVDAELLNEHTERMDLASVVVSLITGLFGGAVGGVLSARRITRTAEKERARVAAEEHIRSTVTTYRATMVHDRNEVYRTSTYPPEYTSWESEEAFALDLLREVSPLPTKAQRRIRAELLLLLGADLLQWAEQHVFVLPSRFDPEREKARVRLRGLQELSVPDPGNDAGLFSRMRRTQNELASHQAAFEETLRSLDRILAEVSKH